MIELVYWSFVLAFTPIVLVITWRILDAAAGFSTLTAIGPPHYSPIAASTALSASAGSTLRMNAALTNESMREPESCDLYSGYPLVPIKDEHSYRGAVATLDRLFMLDGMRSPAEREYFRALTQLVSEYECKHEQ